MEEKDESVNIKNPSKIIIRKRYLSPLQKLGLSIILFTSLILIYKINIISNYLIDNFIIDIKSFKNDKKIENLNDNLKHDEIKKNHQEPSKTEKNKKLTLHKVSNSIPEEKIILSQSKLEGQMNMPIFDKVNKKRTFERRYPLPKEINCQEHMRDGGLLDLLVFTSFLTKNTIFFEFASGCSSIIAKYYCKKSYAVEANKKWYDIGVKNGLKDNLLFRDLKCDGSGGLLSYPGKKSTMEDWKNFFQAYKKEYDADVILIDGRFRVACAFDVFSKIKKDTVVMLHEYKRPQYSVINQYYDLIYEGGSLGVFIKKNNINEIPLDVQEKYWTQKI